MPAPRLLPPPPSAIPLPGVTPCRPATSKRTVRDSVLHVLEAYDLPVALDALQLFCDTTIGKLNIDKSHGLTLAVHPSLSLSASGVHAATALNSFGRVSTYVTSASSSPRRGTWQLRLRYHACDLPAEGAFLPIPHRPPLHLKKSHGEHGLIQCAVFPLSCIGPLSCMRWSLRTHGRSCSTRSSLLPACSLLTEA